MQQSCSGWFLPFYQFQVPEHGGMPSAGVGCNSMKLMCCGALVVTSSPWGRNLAGHDHELCLPFPPLCQQQPKPKDRMFHQSQKRSNSLHKQVTFKALQKQKACSRLNNNHHVMSCHITRHWLEAYSSLPQLGLLRIGKLARALRLVTMSNTLASLELLTKCHAVEFRGYGCKKYSSGEDLFSDSIYFSLRDIQRYSASVYAYTMHKHVIYVYRIPYTLACTSNRSLKDPSLSALTTWRCNQPATCGSTEFLPVFAIFWWPSRTFN